MTNDQTEAREALAGFDVHMQAGMPSHVILGGYESEQIIAHMKAAGWGPLPAPSDPATESPSDLGFAAYSASRVAAPPEDVTALIAEGWSVGLGPKDAPDHGDQYRRLIYRLTAALAAARPLPETEEWEYICDGEGYRRFTDNAENAAKWAARGYTVRRRTKGREPGPWSPLPSADLCAHCGLRLLPNGNHAEGKNEHLHRCDPSASGLPYGYNGHPVGTPCKSPCLGESRPDPRIAVPSADLGEESGRADPS